MFSEAIVLNARVHSGVIGKRIVNDQIVTDQCHPVNVSIDHFTVYNYFGLLFTQLILEPPIHWTLVAWIAHQPDILAGDCCFVHRTSCKAQHVQLFVSTHKTNLAFHTKNRSLLTANRRSACLRQKSAFIKNIVCDLDLWTHNLGNVTSVTWTWHWVNVISFIDICTGISEVGEKMPKVLISSLCGLAVF